MNLLNHLHGMDLLLAKSGLLFAVAFFVPALLAYLVTPAPRKTPRRAMPAPMLLDDEPKTLAPTPEVKPEPAPAARPAPVAYLDAAAEAFTAGILARPQSGASGPYTPLPVGIVHGASPVTTQPQTPAHITLKPQGDNLQRRVSSLAAMSPHSVVAAVEQAGVGLEPARLSAPQGSPDDLSVLSGVTPGVEAELNALGIWHYWQVAGWGPEQVAWIANRIRPGDRVARENWMAQAAKLAKL
jgi:NADH-quinone oxidoreductase subunit E